MSRRRRPGPRSGGVSFGRACGVSAGQAGVLAMVMTAGAMRVTVSFAVGVREGRGGLGLAGAVPVAVDGVPVFRDLAGHGLVAGVSRGGSRTGPPGRRGRRTGRGAGPRARRGVPSARGPRRARRRGRRRGSSRWRRPRPRAPAGPGPGSRSGASARCPGRRRAAAPWPPAARSPTRPTAIYRARRARGRGIPRQSMRSVTRQNISGTSWPSTSAKYSMTRTRTVTPSPDSSAR